MSHMNTVQKKIEELQTTLKRAKQSKEFGEKTSPNQADILDRLSHELKTPIHGILGFAEIGMKQSQFLDRGKLQEYFTEINSNGQKLLSLLDDLLDLSKNPK